MKVANAHDFPKIKQLASVGLEACSDIGIAERIRFYFEFSVNQDFLLPHLLELVRRDDYLSDSEIETLGGPLSRLFWRARESFTISTGGRKNSALIKDDNTAKKALLEAPGASLVIPMFLNGGQVLSNIHATC